ncbi:acyl-CoA synthetase (AMP-forming)/AMP-acid ligase II [Nocardioides sp. BE266]|uniref:class I adenylate-forming enzyme family protein n=1 Tax=Nocardioides sp. BE266 TaxID=2817725 RepID=UPI00285D18FB|nr:AMP-binding protein [Nocardioides sp. BE266]MDR7254287.1 acyl-CoA synthetase (AMP-forming)/AMP-acid ligase II [Nocardioides sp. BE266]
MWLHPEIRALHQIPAYWKDRTPDKVAVRAGHADVTYAELEARVAGLAAALTGRAGADVRRPVGFLGKNVPEVWEVWFGAGRAGLPFVPLNWRSPVAELADVVRDAAPGVVFVDADHADTMQAVAAIVEDDIEVVPFTSVADSGPGLAPWASSRAGGEVTPARGHDVALLAYTSGTTGSPKGAMVLNEAFSLSILSDELEPTISWSPDDVLLMVMPNFHLAGTWVSLPALYHGATVAMVPAFEPAAVLAAVERWRPTVACLVPTAIQFLVGSDAASSTDFSSLRTLIYAGSPMPTSVIDRALEVLGCELRQFYGTTETYIISILRPDDHATTDEQRLPVKASAGKPVPLVEIKVVDLDGAEVGVGVTGQVLVRSPMVMAGYLGKPSETANVMNDGWYATGDLGYLDEGGYLFLVDRLKDMVVTGGENVYSVEVERALQRSDKVAMVAVVGSPDEKWGEVVTAYVVPSPSATEADPAELAEELKEHTRSLIAAYKVPKVIHVVDGLPMTSSGKVRKVELRQQAVREGMTSQ